MERVAIIKESIICDLGISTCTKKSLGGSTATKAQNAVQANLFLSSPQKSMMNMKFKKTYQQSNLFKIYSESKPQIYANKKFTQRYYLHIKLADSQFWANVVSATTRHASLPLSS